MSGFELLGAWLSIAFTLMLLSFLYDDNPIYKVAEHVFLGVSIGVAVTEQYFGVLKPHMVDKLVALGQGEMIGLVYFLPLILVVLLFAKLDPKRSYLARIPIAILVAAYAGVKLTGEANANLMRQMSSSMPDLRRSFAENLPVGTETTLGHLRFEDGARWVQETVVGTCETASSQLSGLWCMGNDGAGVLSSLILVVGLICALGYFYFGDQDNRATRATRTVGIWTLMIGFGASFGYTVMGRISLAIGRAQELLGKGLSEEQYDQIQPVWISVLFSVAIVAALFVWRRRQKGTG
jgi:hypothetical protein